VSLLEVCLVPVKGDDVRSRFWFDFLRLVMSRTAAMTARPSSVPVWDKVTFTGNWRRPLPPAQARWGHHAVLVYNFVPIESRAPTPGGAK
jgi:hypothetical protein